MLEKEPRSDPSQGNHGGDSSVVDVVFMLEGFYDQLVRYAGRHLPDSDMAHGVVHVTYIALSKSA